jgi:hypothetical protein
MAKLFARLTLKQLFMQKKMTVALLFEEIRKKILNAVKMLN